MSHFYGTLQGMRGEASRRGSKASGIETNAASWDGAIRVSISHNEQTEKDEFVVSQISWQGRGIGQELAWGTIGEPSLAGILNRILDKKREALPALIGLDPELDKIIEQKLKEV